VRKGAALNSFGSHFSAGDISQFVLSPVLNQRTGTISPAGPNATEIVCNPVGSGNSELVTILAPGALNIDPSTDNFCCCTSFNIVTLTPGASGAAQFTVAVGFVGWFVDIGFSPNFLLLGGVFVDSGIPATLGPHTVSVCTDRSSGTITFNIDGNSVPLTPGTYPSGVADVEMQFFAQTGTTPAVLDVIMDEFCLKWGKAA
jgi:hypothetical protein